MSELSLEKRINWSACAIVLALLGNMLTGVWYASRLTLRVESLEQKTLSMATDRELLVRIDERIRSMELNISDVKKQLSERK